MNWLIGLGLLSIITLPPGVAQAQRVALVFGNNQYAQVNVLHKAGNDAAAMLKALTKAGFLVVNKTGYRDLDRRAMLDARDDLLNRLAAGDQVVVFYSGHGVQIGVTV